MRAEKMLTLLDVTRLSALSGDEQEVLRLLAQLQGFSVAALCVYPAYLPLLKSSVRTPLNLATVINFPQGKEDLPTLLQAAEQALQAGADEVDMVFPYQDLLAGNVQLPLNMLQAVKKVCMAHQAKLKVILETGALSAAQIAQAAQIAIAAGADFLKTSTGKIAQGATLEAVDILCRVIAAENASERVGIKISGGIKTIEQAQQYLDLIARYFGDAWLRADKVRIGASALFTQLRQQTLQARAQAWLAQDPDETTRAELQALLASEDAEVLAPYFAQRLQFGTAGLRARLQTGSNGMNRVSVAQTAKGIAQYLRAEQEAPSMVIGYDARQNSQIFAQDSAAILQGAGVKTFLLPRALPTPVLAYAVRALNCSAGIMVTASHNPPQDNGYKVYLGNADGGAQIVSPADQAIAACIQEAAEQDIRQYPRDENYQILDDSLWQDYCQRSAALANQQPMELDYVYTAMHGVGAETLMRCLQLANYPLPQVVEAQIAPDGRFPTVVFPNPEEEGALDLAFQTAEKKGIDWVLAHDPDADRLAVGIYQAGKWQRLQGNTIGYWLAWEAAQAAKAQGKTGVMASSLVSGPLLKNIAAAYGLDYQMTLTGFKWIGRVPDLLFGYEEALGYLVDPDKVHDKDGISAAIAFLNLALKLKRQGKSFADYARDFEEKFGAYASGQIAVRKQNTQAIEAMMQGIRSQKPEQLAGVMVEKYMDYQQTTLKANILSLHLHGDEAEARVVFRPSGTEPKLKIYLDTLAKTPEQAQRFLQQLAQALHQQYVDGEA